MSASETKFVLLEEVTTLCNVITHHRLSRRLDGEASGIIDV